MVRMMSTQNQAEHCVIQSSIALLQERFKQLQRVKEMREKKQLLTIFSDSYKITPNSNNYETTFSHNTTTNDGDGDGDGDVVDVDYDDELQIFLPPNYYNSRKPSCYSSSSSSSSVLSHKNRGYHNDNNNLTGISLSLWPTAMSYTDNVTTTAGDAAERFRRAKFEASPLATGSAARPSSCVSSAYKFEDSHVSDVDTTLHL